MALVLKAAQQPLRILIGREIQKSIKDSAKRLIDDTIERCGLSGFFESTDTEIRGRNGSLFLFTGVRSNIASIKSMEGIDIFWGLEANKFSQSSIETIVPTIRKAGSECWWDWNPDLDSDPVDVMFRGADGPPPKSIVREVNYQDNPWFPQELRDQAEYDRKRDIDKYNHVWLGHYRQNSEARVFRNWTVEEFDAPNDAVFRFGADWGFSIDPTVLIRCHLDGRKLFIDHEAYMVGCEIDQTPELFDHVPGARRWLITADSARPETISFMQRQGFKMAPAIKGARSLEEGVEFLKAYEIIVHPRCRETISELTHYSYKIDDLTGQVLPILADKDNHLIDALRYAVEGVRRAARPSSERKISIPIPRGQASWMAA